MDTSNIPAEVWAHICQYLDTGSLRNLSLVDKACQSGARLVLFKKVSIEPRQASEFKQLVEKNDLRKHIRTLEIRSGLPSTLCYDQVIFPDLEFLDNFQEKRSFRPNPRTVMDFWSPMRELVEALAPLRDLIWTCPQQFPACLLRLLHEDLRFSSCRLHLRAFALHAQGFGPDRTLDHHDLMLLQSPNLHSIWFSFHFSVKTSTIARILHGVASNLRHVRLLQKPLWAHESDDPETLQLEDFEAATSGLPYKQGRLESLEFAGARQGLPVSALEAWSECTDFSALKQLVLDVEILSAPFAALARPRFPHLTSLVIRTMVDPGDDVLVDISVPAQDFLCNIPPLKALKLSGQMDYRCLREVIRHHGKALCTLCIEPMDYSPHRLSLPAKEVSWIAKHCHGLENLDLTMHRSKGNRREAAAYSAIGNIRTLQFVKLSLDASEYIEESKFRFAGSEAEFDWERPMKNTLINAALDEKLARSIYSKIVQARPTRSLILDTIELQSVGCGDFGPHFAVPSPPARVANEIQRRCLFKRQYGLSGEDVTTVCELEHTCRLSTSRESSRDRNGVWRDGLNPRVAPVFQRLWPESIRAASGRMIGIASN